MTDRIPQSWRDKARNPLLELLRRQQEALTVPKPRKP